MRLPVTYLFVPGNRPERYDKALSAGADAVILDLEDAVSPEHKERARGHVEAWVAAHPEILSRVVVRINAAATPWFDSDIGLVRRCRLEFVMLPKAEAAAPIAALAVALPPAGRVLPLIESARGVDSAAEVAAAPAVQRLVFGTLDYAADLDLSGDERGLYHAAARIAHVSRGAGLGSPVGGVTPAVDDEARLLADLAFGRAFGFGAKLCIHPKQVAVIAAAMRPTQADVDWATRVLAAAAQGTGAVQVDGRMVDRPVLLKAQAILDRASGS